ncbi:hypothetical protein ACFLTC_03525 [Chloroflexota bacterium]
MPTPEEEARETIATQLDAAGWRLQDRDALNLGASLGVAVREFPLQTGFARYMLFVDRKAVGVVDEQKHDPKTIVHMRNVPFYKLPEAVALGTRDQDTLASLAGRPRRPGGGHGL